MPLPTAAPYCKCRHLARSHGADGCVLCPCLSYDALATQRPVHSGPSVGIHDITPLPRPIICFVIPDPDPKVPIGDSRHQYATRQQADAAAQERLADGDAGTVPIYRLTIQHVASATR